MSNLIAIISLFSEESFARVIHTDMYMGTHADFENQKGPYDLEGSIGVMARR